MRSVGVEVRRAATFADAWAAGLPDRQSCGDPEPTNQ